MTMMMSTHMTQTMNFTHKTIDLGYEDLLAETLSTGRTYSIPNGKKYPSVTTVLSILSEDFIREWRQRVGAEEANRVSRRAAGRGTAVHKVAEKYLLNDPEWAKGLMPIILANFRSIRPVLDNHINNIYALEAPLYSDHLGVAGRVDCIAEFDGVISIIDFKTSAKLKLRENIEGYFIQESFYAVAFEERTGIPVNNLVTIIAVDNEKPQVFIEKRDKWIPKLKETIAEFNKRKLFGRK
jgi:genome maintenance exonuclease 1